MDLITYDFETYYAKDYGFKTHTTEEYVRDQRFEVIGVAVKVNDGETEWASGTYEELKVWLSRFRWGSSMALAHNAMFDGFILHHHFDTFTFLSYSLVFRDATVGKYEFSRWRSSHSHF